MSKDKHHQSFSHVHLFDDKYQLSYGSLACFSGRLCYCQILYNESWVVSDCFCQAIKSFFSSLKQQVKCKLKFQELQNTYSRKRDSTPTPATSLLILNVVFKPALRLAMTMPFRIETRCLFSGASCPHEQSYWTESILNSLHKSKITT